MRWDSVWRLRSAAFLLGHAEPRSISLQLIAIQRKLSMKILLRIVGALFIAVGLFWFGPGAGLLGWPHNAALGDYGAAVTALGIALTWFAVLDFLRPLPPPLTPP